MGLSNTDAAAPGAPKSANSSLIDSSVGWCRGQDPTFQNPFFCWVLLRSTPTYIVDFWVYSFLEISLERLIKFGGCECGAVSL
jgi:hypothetical protein